MIAFFLFYNHGEGKLSRFSMSDEFRHCNVMTFDGSMWNLWTWTPRGINIRPAQVKSVDALFRTMRLMSSLTACIVVEIYKPHLFKFSPFGVHSCNELSRYVTGVDIGYTLTPKHLYKKLLKYGKIRNYTILKEWRRHGQPRSKGQPK